MDYTFYFCDLNDNWRLFGFSLIVQEFLFCRNGIVFSVILLGIVISIENKIPTKLIMVFVAAGLFHGIAHGLTASSTNLFYLFRLHYWDKFLHLFGVVIGHLLIKIATRFIAINRCVFLIYGIYLLSQIF